MENKPAHVIHTLNMDVSSPPKEVVEAKEQAYLSDSSSEEEVVPKKRGKKKQQEDDEFDPDGFGQDDDLDIEDAASDDEKFSGTESDSQLSDILPDLPDTPPKVPRARGRPKKAAGAPTSPKKAAKKAAAPKPSALDDESEDAPVDVISLSDSEED